MDIDCPSCAFHCTFIFFPQREIVMIYLLLIAYLAFTFWGSLINNHEEDTPEAFFLAGRNLKTITLFFTILATNFSAFYFLGFAGEAYRIGYAHYFIMAFGTGFAALSIYFIGQKSWKLSREHHLITPAELIRHKSKSSALSYLYAAIQLIYTIPYFSIQIIGGGYILEKLTKGELNYHSSIILLTFFTILYVLRGGMKAVAKTDVKQGVLMIIFMFAALAVISYQLGGLEKANVLVWEKVPELFQIQGRDGHYTMAKWFSFTIFWFFCIPMFPQLFMRFFIAEKIEYFNKSVLYYACIPLVISIFPVIIGILGHLSYPDLSGKEADQILPMMLTMHSPEWFYGLVMIGAIAAFMSTLDSQLLAVGTIVSRDFLLPMKKGDIDLKRQVNYGKISIVIFALIGLWIAMDPFDTIFQIGKLAFAGYAILFPITVAYLFGKPLNAAFSIILIFFAQILLWLFNLGLLNSALLMGLDPCIFILFLQVISIVIYYLFKLKISRIDP